MTGSEYCAEADRLLAIADRHSRRSQRQRQQGRRPQAPVLRALAPYRGAPCPSFRRRTTGRAIRACLEPSRSAGGCRGRARLLPSPGGICMAAMRFL